MLLGEGEAVEVTLALLPSFHFGKIFVRRRQRQTHHTHRQISALSYPVAVRAGP